MLRTRCSLGSNSSINRLRFALVASRAIEYITAILDVNIETYDFSGYHAGILIQGSYV